MTHTFGDSCWNRLQFLKRWNLLGTWDGPQLNPMHHHGSVFIRAVFRQSQKFRNLLKVLKVLLHFQFVPCHGPSCWWPKKKKKKKRKLSSSTSTVLSSFLTIPQLTWNFSELSAKDFFKIPSFSWSGQFQDGGTMVWGDMKLEGAVRTSIIETLKLCVGTS